MRIVVFANNRVGVEVVRYLTHERPETLAGLIVHPPERAKYRREIVESSGLESERIVEAPSLSNDASLETINSWKPDLGLSVYFGYILEHRLIDLFSEGCLNLHPSLLPYNRGVHTNVWSIVDGTPAGASFHYLDQRVDAGDILAQKHVTKRATDTGESLYYRLEDGCIELFRNHWPKFVDGERDGEPQQLEKGTYHETGDLEAIDRIDLDAEYSARELLNRLRARTFPPYEGCYVESGGTKIFLRLHLWDEDNYPPENDN